MSNSEVRVESRKPPPSASARLVIKNSFLEFVNASPCRAARDLGGIKTDSFLPEIDAPLPNESSCVFTLPNEPSGLSDNDTEAESCDGYKAYAEEDWDADASCLGTCQEEPDKDSRAEATNSEEEANVDSESSDDQPRVLKEDSQKRQVKGETGKSSWIAKAGLRLQEPSAAAMDALPAMTAAAAAAALEAACAGVTQEVLRLLPPSVGLPPVLEGFKRQKPEVISVADALDSPVAAYKVPRFDPFDTRTTVMLRNLPNNYTRSMLVALLESEGFKGKFDFLYLPIDFRSKAGLGYAFVNLVAPSIVPEFWINFSGFSKWVLPSAKVCHVSWSGPHQGQKAHLDRYRNSPIMHSSVPDEYKPVVYAGGGRVTFPGASKKLRAPRRRS